MDDDENEDEENSTLLKSLGALSGAGGQISTLFLSAADRLRRELVGIAKIIACISWLIFGASLAAYVISLWPMPGLNDAPAIANVLYASLAHHFEEGKSYLRSLSPPPPPQFVSKGVAFPPPPPAPP